MRQPSHFPIKLLALVIGGTMVSFGVHQIRRPRAWTHYIPDWLAALLPVSRTTAMRVHGSGNLSLGLVLVLFSQAQLTWLLVAAWWAFVTPLCGRVDWRAGARDASILAAIIGVAIMLGSRDGEPHSL
jgi:hypothetical protein